MTEMYLIPTATNKSNYTQIVSLDGEDYEIKLRWNQRDGRWYISLKKDGVSVLSGKRVVSDWPISWPGYDSPVPPGILMAIDSTGNGIDPKLSDFGDRVHLVYVSEND